MPIDSDSLSLLDLGSQCFSKKESGTQVNVLVLFLSISLKHLAARSRHLKPPVPIIPFDIVAYAFTLLWDNLSQNSCIYWKIEVIACKSPPTKLLFIQ